MKRKPTEDMAPALRAASDACRMAPRLSDIFSRPQTAFMEAHCSSTLSSSAATIRRTCGAVVQ